MHIINITVREKVAAHVRGTYYVCGNSDYMVHFDFDSEWDALDVKTARFIAEDGTIYPDQVFSGSECPVPIISNTNNIRVGVFAGDLHTTTPARVPAVKSILCVGGLPAAPGDDVYSQIMQEVAAAAHTANSTAQAMQETNGTGGGLYLVRVDAENKADRTQAEIIAAADAGKTCLLINFLGRVYVYRGVQQTAFGDGVSCPTFAAPLEWHGKYWLMTSDAYVYEDGTVSFGARAPATTPNPKALKLTGAVDATYDGGEAVTVNIPALPTSAASTAYARWNGTAWVAATIDDLKADLGLT